jgi:hypothetical protein
MPHTSKISRLLFGAVTVVGVACVPPGDGVAPIVDEVYFPVSVTLNRTGEFLFVVNSDFDLKYSQGTIQSLDVRRIRQLVQRVCSADDDCETGETCDVEPTAANDGSPSFSCVGPSGIPCEGAGEKSANDLAVSPGRCAPVDLSDPFDGGSSLLLDVAETSAFATQGLLLDRPCLVAGELNPCAPEAGAEERVQSEAGVSYPERLFVPVRGDTTVHYLDIDEAGQFHCGRPVEDDAQGISTSARCSTNHRISRGKTYGISESGELVTADRPPEPELRDQDEREEGDPVADFRLPPEPLDLAASEDGRVIVVSHQLGGYATTLINSWTKDPEMVHIAEGLSDNPIGVVGLPASEGELRGNWPGFLMTYRTSPRVDLLRFMDDGLLAAVSPAAPSDDLSASGERTLRPKLERVGTTAITLNTAGYDSRGITMDASRRKTAEEACAGDAECAAVAAEIPVDVYVANRTPSSLLVGRTGGEDPEALISSLPQFYDNVPLSSGPSRVVVGFVIDKNGEKARRIFVLCFDSALVYVYDPETRTIESEIRTGRGPYSMAFDEEAGIAFIAHFTDSYVGVVSIDQRHPVTFGSTVLTLGEPVPPRASQ